MNIFSTLENNELCEEDTLKDMYLTFSVANEDYGIEIKHVTSIMGLSKITTVPEMPLFIKGVINLRGRIIPVMDVRARFKIPEIPYTERTCIIVALIESIAVGLVVDVVKEVVKIEEEYISSTPSFVNSFSSQYIRGMARVGNDVKILLNLQKLLFDDEKELLLDISAPNVMNLEAS